MVFNPTLDVQMDGDGPRSSTTKITGRLSMVEGGGKGPTVEEVTLT